jgi:ribosomal protein S18 acetylase RimI-like enzyme
LFAAIAEGARKARLPAIEAYIGNDNSAALDYYEAMGFRTYRESEGVSCKVLWLTAEADV